MTDTEAHKPKRVKFGMLPEGSNRLNSPVLVRTHDLAEPPQFVQFTSKNSFDELIRVARDYQIGKSYCTAAMDYEGYLRIQSWIESKLEQEGASQQSRDAFDQLFNSPSCPEPQFMLRCIAFEEGHLLVTFPDGGRLNNPHTTVLSVQESSLTDLMEVSLRTSASYKGDAPLAALPVFKRRMLDAWLDHKIAERNKLVVCKENELRFTRLLEEGATCKFYDDNYSRARFKEIQTGIRELIFAYPGMEEFLSKTLDSKQAHLERQIIILRDEIRKSKSIERNSIANPDTVPELIVENIESDLDSGRNKEPSLQISENSLITTIRLKNSEGRLESYSLTNGAETLINLRQKARSGACKLKQEEIEVLDEWIAYKKRQRPPALKKSKLKPANERKETNKTQKKNAKEYPDI